MTPRTIAGKPFDQEQPLPSGEAHPPVEREQRLGHRRTDQHGHRRGGHEQGAGLRALDRRNPIGQVQHHSRKEPRLRDAEQDAHRVEAPLPDDEHHRHGHEPPDNHDSRDPHARPDAFENEIARDFEEAVAQKKQAAAKPIGPVAQSEVALKLGLREPDVDPIDVGDDIAEEHERHESADDSGDRLAALDGVNVGHRVTRKSSRDHRGLREHRDKRRPCH